jgi:hypothetical protein
MRNRFSKVFFAIFIITSCYGCATVNDGLEETDKTLKGVESKGTDVVNTIFGENPNSK